MIWYCLLVIPLYIILDNAIACYCLDNIYEKYLKWLSGDKKTKILQDRTNLKRLIEQADIDEAYIPTSQLLGYGQVANYNINVLENFPSNRRDLVVITTRLINDALGVYKQRIINVFNPLWWIKSIIFLPRVLTNYIGINVDSLSVKIIQVLWWMIGVAVTIFKTVYPEYFNAFVDKLLKNLIS